MNNNIRPVLDSDIIGIKNVIDSCGLFPSEYLDDMIFEYLNNSDTSELWYTYVEDNTPVAVAYCVPEKFTTGTYNLLAIGVSEIAQRKGIASKMMHYIEFELKKQNARILIIETSSDIARIGARELYNKIGYKKEATIREFWNEGEDKIIFWKKL